MSIAALIVLVGCSNGSTAEMGKGDAVKGDQNQPSSGNPASPAPGVTGQAGGGASTPSAMGPSAPGSSSGSGGVPATASPSQDSSSDQKPSEPGADDSGPTSDSASEADPAQPVVVADYNEPGPYGPAKRLLNQGVGTVTGGSSALMPGGNSNDPSAFTLYFPEGGEAGETFPLLTFGNGTACSPTFYDEFIGHVVSYGYIVIAPNTSNTGTAVEMLQGVEWALAQNEQPDSPIYGKVNAEHIGAFGHSQGGAGTSRAGADPRIDAIATLSGTSDIPQIQCPAFFVTTGGEAGSSPDARIEQTFGEATRPSMYGITVGGNHDEYTDKVDEGVTALIGLTSDDGLQSRAAVTAWFDWQLKGMTEVGQLFLDEPCAFCNDDNLQRLDLKGF